MSDKCQHNNHSHFFLWMFIWWLTMDACTGGDCSGNQNRNNIRRLEGRLQQLESQCNSKK
jgi:hypothetical protein